MDLCGGCGQIAYYLARQCQEVILTDGSEKALKLAQKRLKKYSNLVFRILDINHTPLPFSDNQFDKIICYSSIHYLDNWDKVKNLIADLLRIIKPRGDILIGDLPSSKALNNYLAQRKKYPFKNFILNTKYYLRKLIGHLIYRRNKVNANQVKCLDCDRQTILNALKDFDGIEYQFVKQNKKLFFADSREDLLITKK